MSGDRENHNDNHWSYHGRRIAAEWEPALGALITWPLSIPQALVVEIAKKDRLFVMVQTKLAKWACQYRFTSWGIDMDQVDFFFAKGDYAWNYTRDWGPFALFDEEMNYSLADTKIKDYPFASHTCGGKMEYEKTPLSVAIAPKKIAETIGFEHFEVAVYITGGNVVFDGIFTAMSTCLTIDENIQYGVSERQFYDDAKRYLGINRFHIISNFEDYGIQHIDCLLKFLDEETILVARPPKGHKLYQRYERIVGELSELKNSYGRSYRIKRIDTAPFRGGKLAAYTNSAILNKRIFVPFYGIDYDESAAKTFRQIMPGYEVVGVLHNKGSNAWQSYDALHCRTSMIWDPKMIYLRHRRLEKSVSAAASYTVKALIVDYSRAGLVYDELKVHWRLRGEADWQYVTFETTSQPSLFSAQIPGSETGQTVEYYLSAADNSGRLETLPRTAPENHYAFQIQ